MRRPLIFQTMKAVLLINQSLKYQLCAPSSKDKGIRKFELKANKKVLAKEKIRNILFSTLVWWYHTSYLYYFSRNTFKQFQNVLGNLNFFPFNIIHQTLGKFLINSKVKE